MGIAERRVREKEELRAKIMDAATELFLKEGFRSVSMRRIAEKIEYAPSTIYLYFQDKNELITAIVEDTFRRLSARLEEQENQQLPPRESLLAGIRLYIRFGMEHPTQYFLAFCTVPDAGLAQEQTQRIDQAGIAAMAHLHRALERCIDAGLISRQDVRVLTQSTWMLMHGVTSALIFREYDCGFPWATPDQLIEKSLDTILHGLLTSVLPKNSS